MFDTNILKLKFSEMSTDEYDEYCEFNSSRSMLDRNHFRVSDLSEKFIEKFRTCLSEDQHGIARLGVQNMKIVFILSLLLFTNVQAKPSYGDIDVKKVISVYDGDTFRADLVSGHPIISKNIRIRLSGIDTAEIKGKCWREKQLAIKARDFLASKLDNGKITLKNIKRGKYFRIVADVFVDGVDINKLLIKKQLAYSYFKGRKNDWCEPGYGWIKLKQI